MRETGWLSSRIRVIEVDYGKVETGKTSARTVEIYNESCNELMYEAQRDPATNPLDHVFHLHSYAWTLGSQEKFICEIRYRPFIAFSTNIDYFNIVDSSGVCLKIIVRGSSIGPEVTASPLKITMISEKTACETKKRIKLTNKSSITATFMFDIDEKHESFKLEVTHGTVNPNSHKYIIVTFIPPEYGKYSCHLPCLILHQDPVIIELFGYCGPSRNVKEYEKAFSYHWRIRNGFEGYMSFTADAMFCKDCHPISLSKHYFDFGQSGVNAGNEQRIPQAICLTNHSDSELIIKWEKDVNGIFEVIPSSMDVRNHQSVLFEMYFNPNVESNLFGREIVASICPKNEDIHTEPNLFPFLTSVRAIGHSFPRECYGWIPQYEIPRAVVMPPCVPPFPVYTTFLIKRFGHLPLTFHFVAPSTSRFIVKPMLGLIRQYDYHDLRVDIRSSNCQIITLAMTPKPENNQIYVERWAVYFNGNKKSESYIDFKGFAEYANVKFSNNNAVTFDAVYPRCEQVERVMMRNVTRHRIRYQFYEIPSELTIEHLQGEIDSNDILSGGWSFCPKGVDVHYDFQVECVVHAVINETGIGPKNCVHVRVAGRSETGFLVAIPNELNFDDVEYNETKTLSFHVFNLSTVNIYYKLICTHRDWPFGNIDNDVEVRPASETVFPGSHEKISVSVTPRTPGYYQFVIRYVIRINCSGDALISEQTPRDICDVSCMCVLPTLKLTNLSCYGFYSNMSKPFLWKSMRINAFNKILESILPGEKRTLNITFDPMIVNEGSIVIKLIIANPSCVTARWKFNRIYRCSCKPVIKKKGLSLHTIDFDCIHDKLCTVNPESGILHRNESSLIALTLRYALVGKTEINWDLEFHHDRHILLNMVIECLSGSECELHFLSGTRLKFGKVFFGNREAICKAHWIQNATNCNLPYSINIAPLCILNETYNCKIFLCESQSGIVEAESCKPIFIKFQPRMFGAYKVALPVKLGDKDTELILEGEACCDFKMKIIGEAMPSSCVYKPEEFSVHFSRDCVNIWNIGTHDRVVKMLMVHNDLKHDALAYEWKKYTFSRKVAGVLRVEVHPGKGIIQPKTVQSFRVEIYSEGCPCKIDVNVPCKLFNASDRRKYQRSVLQYDILSKELKGQFTITEKGTHVPKPWIKILKKPEIFYKTLTVRCSINAPEDENLRISLTQELENGPSRQIFIEKTKEQTTLREGKELSVSLFILECLLWDIVNHSRMENTIQERLMRRRNLNYSQFVMNLAERKRAEKRSYISPPRRIMSSILEELLFIIVHEEFSLETAHLIPKEDIRHLNYLRMLTEEDKSDFEDDNDTPRNDNTVSEKNERSASAVSFLE